MIAFASVRATEYGTKSMQAVSPTGSSCWRSENVRARPIAASGRGAVSHSGVRPGAAVHEQPNGLWIFGREVDSGLCRARCFRVTPRVVQAERTGFVDPAYAAQLLSAALNGHQRCQWGAVRFQHGDGRGERDGR